MNQGMPSENDGGAPATPFWVTRRAAMIAVVATHLAALVVVLAEVLRPVSDGGYIVRRVEALDFVASYAVYGFVACVLLVLLGILLRRLVMRDENYYQEGRK